ncbi:MAG: MBL fold metallo-hydrolase [Cellulosilyticaceae bacterium]
MKIERMTVGMLQEHTYFIIDEESAKAFIVDPGAEPHRILEKITADGLSVEGILLTHGHFDHIGAVTQIREELGCPVIIHECGKAYISNPDYNLSSVFAREDVVFEADRYVEHGDMVEIAGTDISLKVVFAPGHTSDGVVYYSDKEKVAFVGDIIFNGSIGRTDNPGGDMTTLLVSIKKNIFTLPEETVIYSGHGESTTVKREKNTNPFFHIYD